MTFDVAFENDAENILLVKKKLQNKILMINLESFSFRKPVHVNRVGDRKALYGVFSDGYGLRRLTRGRSEKNHGRKQRNK